MTTGTRPAADPSADSSTRFRFGTFELDDGSGDLSRQGRPVALSPRPLAVLRVLVANAGRTVTRRRLRESVWGAEAYLEFDQSLNSCIRRLRAALGDDPQAPRFIETVPRRGYRFIAPVEPVRTPTAEGDVDGPHDRANRRTGGLVISIALLMVVVAAAWMTRGAARPASRPTAPLTVALLPLESSVPEITAGGEIGAALEQQLELRLRALEPARLRVLGSTTSAALAEGSAGARALVATLDHELRAILSSSGDRLRLDLSLSDSARRPRWRGHRIWARSTDLGRVDRLLASLVDEIAVELLGRPAAPATATPAPRALAAFLRGRYQERLGDPESLQLALASYDEAIAHDPGYAAALGHKAKLLSVMGWPDARPSAEVLAAAAATAARALALDSTEVDALLASSYVDLYYRWDLASARRVVDDALELAPGRGDVYSAHAAVLAAAGRADEAVDAARIAQELDPLNLAVRSDHCWYLLYADSCGRALDLEPTNAWIRLALAVAQGRNDPALALETWRKLVRDTSTAIEDRGTSSGSPEERLKELLGRAADRQAERSLRHKALSLEAAAAYAAAGELDPALDALERAIDDRLAFVVFVGLDPRFDALRQEPRFAALMERVRPLT